MLEYLRSYGHNFGQLEELLKDYPNVLKLRYEEDILSQPLEAYRRACEFLGLKPHDVSVRYVKTTPFPTVDVIANYWEVEAALRGTEFEWMLQDGSA